MCEPGESESLLHAGETLPTGSMAINPSGGFLCFGEATTAQGLGVDVVLATLTPVTDAREASDPGTRAALLALNAQIRLTAAQLGLGDVVDLYAALNGVPGVIGADGFHPTATGYRRMAELFFAEIVSRYDITPRAPAIQKTP